MNDESLILIIDDDTVVQKLLSALLSHSGYRILQSFTGVDGLDLATRQKPDLILLDVMMPVMSGFEVIERLKQDESLADVPVIFLSAKIESTDKVKGLELGAADFINKPFDRAELMARIRTHLKLKQQDEALRKYSMNLEQMVEERTRQLIHADRLASLGTLSAGIAHEINNPTTFITGNLQTIEQVWKRLGPILENNPDVEADQLLQSMVREFPAMIRSIRNGAERIINIVSGLKAFSRKESPVKGLTDLVETLAEAESLTHNRLKYHVRLEKDFEANVPRIMANAQQLVQVFVNLMLNSADAIGDRDGVIRIRLRRVDRDRVELRFEDDGPGIPANIRNKIFDPFFTTKPVGEGTGLGLAISHGIIQDHGGRIEVENGEGRGAAFLITLPMEREK